MGNNSEITLVVASPISGEINLKKDREGAELHGLKLPNLFSSEKNVDLEKVKKNFNDCIAKVEDMLKGIQTKVIEGWETESVSISLAVSAEGSIGIATAGVEAGIEITFVPKKKE